MKNTDLRAKARAIFGSAVAEPMPNQPNGAKALQQRANARPIPTYTVGGAVKKMPTPGDSVASGNRMSKMEADESRFMDMLDKKKAMPSARNAVDSGNRMSKMEGAEMRKMKMAMGGKVQTASDTARKLATEMGGMRKGGKVKPVSVDMEGLEAMTRSMRPAVKDDLEMKVMQARNLAATRKREMEETAPKKQSFNQAFGAARERGDKTFSWNGGSYGTQLKGETPKADRPVAPAARPAAPAPRAAAPEVRAPAPRAPATAPAPRAAAPAPTARATAPATRGKVGFANAAPALAGAKSAIDRGLSGIDAFFEAANAGAGGAERARRANIAAAAAKRAKAKEDYDPSSAASNLKLALGNFAKGGKVKGDKPKNGLAVMIAIGKVKPVKKMNGGPMAARGMDMEAAKLTRQMAGGGDPMGYMAGGAPMGYAAGGAGKTRKGQAPIKKAQGGAAKVRKGMMTPEGNITHAMNKIRGE
jgi:hypothetical protein